MTIGTSTTTLMLFFLFLLLGVSHVAASSTYLNVFGDAPTIELFYLPQHEAGVASTPTLTNIGLFGAAPHPRRMYYVDGRLLDTAWDLSTNTSALWLWWQGYELDGERLLLLDGGSGDDEGSDEDPLFEAACAHDDAGRCAFDVVATGTTGLTYRAVLFAHIGDTAQQETATLLPRDLYVQVAPHDGATPKDLVLTSTSGAMSWTLHGPFALDDSGDGVPGDIVVSTGERHHHNFRFDYDRVPARVRVFERGTFQGRASDLSTVVLTIVILVAAVAIVIGWTTSAAAAASQTPSSDHVLLELPWYVLPWIFPGPPLRLVAVGLMVVRWVVGRTGGRRRPLSTAYGALSTAYAATMILHEGATNLSSVAAHMALVATAACDAVDYAHDGPDTRKTPRPPPAAAAAAPKGGGKHLWLTVAVVRHGVRAPPPPRQRSHLQAVLAWTHLAVLFVAVYLEDVAVYTMQHWEASYGLQPHVVASVAMAFLLELALHLRVR